MTNRLTIFDDALQSRIYFAMKFGDPYYKGEDDLGRLFLQKMTMERLATARSLRRCERVGIDAQTYAHTTTSAVAPRLCALDTSRGVSLTQGLTAPRELTRLRGSVTLGPEQGELGANFCDSSVWCQNILIPYFGFNAY
jgi:hypothetical protein